MAVDSTTLNNGRKIINGCRFGFFNQAIINNLAPLLYSVFRSEYGISTLQISFLMFLNFGMQIIFDIATIKLHGKISYKALSAFGCAMCAAGLCVMGLIGSYGFICLCIAVGIYAIGAGINDVTLSPMISTLPDTDNEKTMNRMHAFYCWGQVFVIILVTVFIKAAGRELWFILPFMLAAVPVTAMILFVCANVSAQESAPLEKAGAFVRSNAKVIFLLLAAMFCIAAIEVSISQWCSLFTEYGLNVEKYIGDLFGAATFALCIGVGRIIAIRLQKRMSLVSMFTMSIIAFSVSLILVITLPSSIAALIFLAVCGLCLSFWRPGIYNLCKRSLNGAPTVLYGSLSLAADVGGTLVPWSLGLMISGLETGEKVNAFAEKVKLTAESLSLRGGMAVLIIIALMMLIIFLIYRREEKKNESRYEEVENQVYNREK